MTTDPVAQARRHSVGDLLRRTALRYPDKVALIAEERRLTYAEFDASVNRCAHALADRGLGKGDRLALLSHNCRHYAVLAFATARLGAVLVPVNFMLNADEVAYILSHSGAGGLVTEDTLAPTAETAIASAGLSGGIRGWIGRWRCWGRGCLCSGRWLGSRSGTGGRGGLICIRGWAWGWGRRRLRPRR
jgi:fatty-acyl-CoA synthase